MKETFKISSPEGYVKAATKWLARHDIVVGGSGYIQQPVSKRIAAAVDANYFVAFEKAIKNSEVREQFLISRDFVGETIKVEKEDLGLAIKQISKIAGQLKRKIKLVPNLTPEQLAQEAAEKEAKEEREFLSEIRRVARKR